LQDLTDQSGKSYDLTDQSGKFHDLTGQSSESTWFDRPIR